MQHPTKIPSSAPLHFPTDLPGVMLFREQHSTHHYRVWHEDWYAFCVVDAGLGEIRYRGRTLCAEPGSVLAFAPGNVHETRQVPAPASYWVLLIPVAHFAARGVTGELDWAPEPWTDPQLFARFRDTCTALANPQTPLIDRELLYADLLDAILATDRRAHATQKQSVELTVVRRVREHLVSQPLDCKIQLAGVAEALGWSAGYVSKAFSCVGACPPKTLLRLVRVERARKAIETGSDSLIKTAALEAGFPTPEKFIQAFRVAWNLSPSQYRQRHRHAAVPPMSDTNP